MTRGIQKLDITDTPFVLGHRPALDGLRGLAILAVLLFHTSPPLATGGFIGVEVFFVLSGFLITSLLLAEHQSQGAIDLIRFYLRRGLRLLPALLSVLAALWLFTLVWGSRRAISILQRDSIAILLYIHNWRLAHTSWHHVCFQLTPLWSLSVEEQFYLVWPATLAVLLKWRARRLWIVGLVVATFLLPVLLRAWLWTGRTAFLSLYFSTYTRADGLASGCLIALFTAWWTPHMTPWRSRFLRMGAWLALSVLAVFLFVSSPFSPFMYHGGFEVVNLCSAILIAALVWTTPSHLHRLLSIPALRWLGRISYGAYLWNHVWFCAVYYGTFIAVPPAFTPEAGSPLSWKAILIWTGTLLFGALSHYLIERPFLRWKDCIRPTTRTTQLAPHPVLRAA